VEVIVVAAVLVPFLGALFALAPALLGALDANDQAGAGREAIERVMVRTMPLIAGAKESTLQVRATQGDIDAAVLAGLPAPALGDWIEMPELDPRPAIRFDAPSGAAPGIDATTVWGSRELSFELDPGESANSADDDGDGLTDEGRLRLSTAGGPPVDLVGGAIAVVFEREGRVVRMRTRLARPRRGGSAWEATREWSAWMRN
jgi:hypothetical protein